MIKKVLIANRGEIAVRIIKTCKEMGIKTVAVFSKCDERSLHTILADESIYIGESDPVKSYLNIDKIIEVAKKTNSDAIHPGYGFLGENAKFAKACCDNGIIFIGPSFKTISDLGDKIAARKLMQKHKIPVIPGMTHCEIDDNRLKDEAEKIGYPVMVKAAFGGGGKGMRIVKNKDKLIEACKLAASEAKNAFSNDAIYLEKYIKNPRHIEVQILADCNGNIVHLFERECSIQRRHQKIIEETPACVLSDELRKKICNTAVKVATAANYTNAGTVEFLLDTKNKNFYFLEVNTRLQVEHPITEMVTGIDIVREQINIASQNKLSFKQEDIKVNGHAIECRIYAEDPVKNFLPSPGKIVFTKEPKGPGVRIDSGVSSESLVPIEYDPILSKLIVFAKTRNHAIDRMQNALKDYVILGVKTIIPFLIDILNSENFLQSKFDTNFIEKEFSNWKPYKTNKDKDIAAISYIISKIESEKGGRGQMSGGRKKKEISPWKTLGNWRI